MAISSCIWILVAAATAAGAPARVDTLSTHSAGEANGRVQRICEIPAEILRDKIRGGLLGQILGNLNGLPHEMKYIAEPGNVTEYVPALPEGAWTDDDTDLEWVYIKVMEDEDCPFLPPERIARLWRERINRRIWCSNQYARQLMDLGIEPPLTGMSVLNPWADFNISGQFLCETFGLIAPAMPQTSTQDQARAAYCAICLDLAASLRQEHPQPWSDALTALGSSENVVQVLFHHSPTPRGGALRKKAFAAGLGEPAIKKDLW